MIALALAGFSNTDAGTGERSIWAYLLVGLLVLYASYLLLRLFILDRLNREAPHQEDPRERVANDAPRERVANDAPGIRSGGRGGP